jgi:phenylacetate-CoA ligase
MVKHAFQHSSFYNELYKSYGLSFEDLATVSLGELPVVDKSMIMENFDKVLTVDDVSKEGIFCFLEKYKDPSILYNNKYHVIHTSGSSGKIGVFVYNSTEWDYFFPFITRVFNFSFHKSTSAFYGAIDGHFAGVSFSHWLGKGITRFFVDPLILDITKPVDTQVELLNRFQPSILGGYFMGLKILAEQQANGLLNIQPKQVVNCGEGVHEPEKSFIEKVFQAPVSNLYGLAECVVLGAGTDKYGGIYLMDDLGIIEIQDDCILLTNLFNKTQPLIRYRIPDILLLKQDNHKLLPFTLVDSIVGRKESLLWLQNDKGEMDFIHPIVISEIYTKGLDKLQIVVHNESYFEFLAVIRDEPEEIVVTKLKEIINKILSEKKFTSVQYLIKVVDSLEIDKETGKFQLIKEKNKYIKKQYFQQDFQQFEDKNGNHRSSLA